jgi:pimeloyl-ACP methyl ester carboxylesterase
VSPDRIHRATSDDGTEIVGRVHGDGPPLVLFHGAPHDGDLAWETLIPHLANQFTCYVPSWRGRGLSGDSEDHAPPRHEEDATAFVDSIGGPVHVAGWSIGVVPTLGAAANSDAVTAVALYEPTITQLFREADVAEVIDVFQEVDAAAADGRLADAARAFHPFVATDDELDALDADYFERSGAAFAPLLRSMQAAQTYEGPRATDPEALERINAPVLLLRGQQTRLATFYCDTERYVAENVADPHLRELPGVGHFAPTVAPAAVADELIRFFGAPAMSGPSGNHAASTHRPTVHPDSTRRHPDSTRHKES